MYLCVFCVFLSVQVLSVHFLSSILLLLQLIDDGDETVPSEDKNQTFIINNNINYNKFSLFARIYR